MAVGISLANVWIVVLKSKVVDGNLVKIRKEGQLADKALVDSVAILHPTNYT